MTVDEEIRAKESSLYRWRSTSYGGTLAGGIIVTVLSASALLYSSIFFLILLSLDSYTRRYVETGTKVFHTILFILGFIFLFVGISLIRSFAEGNRNRNSEIRRLEIEIAALKSHDRKTVAAIPTGATNGKIVTLAGGKWRCVCGRVNEAYTGTCACGINKALWKAEQLKKEKEQQEKEAAAARMRGTASLDGGLHSEASEKKTAAPSVNFAALRELKGLLDDGIITKEEFERKKKEYLGDAAPAEAPEIAPKSSPAVSRSPLSISSELTGAPSKPASADMKFCPVCGTRQSRDARYCAGCGHAF